MWLNVFILLLLSLWLYEQGFELEKQLKVACNTEPTLVLVVILFIDRQAHRYWYGEELRILRIQGSCTFLE